MVTFGIIEKEIRNHPDYCVHSLRFRGSGDIKLYGYSVLRREESLRENWLYLTNPETPVPGGAKNCAFLCLGTGGRDPGGDTGFLSCDIPGGMEALGEFAGEVFARFHRWADELDGCLRTEDVQRMLELSAPLFGATVSLFDSEYRWLGISGPEYPFYRENNGQLPADFIRTVMDDHREREIHSRRGAFLAPDPENFFNTQAIRCNLFLHDLFWGSIVVMDHRENRSFRPGDYAILNHLAQRAELLLRQQAGDLRPAQHMASGLALSLLRKALRGERVEPEALKKAMTAFGWQEGGECFVGHLFLNQDHAPDSAKAFYCRYIMRENRGVAAVEGDDHIVLLIPRWAYPRVSDFVSGFVLILRENNFRLGLSNCCTDLGELAHYHRQALAALELGTGKMPHHWYHYFQDYALDYLLGEKRDIPMRYLRAEKLLTLAAYDRENDTEYVRTLDVYLQNQMNAVKTAKDLYIHHATMVFRLKRLKEILETDLKDMRQIVELYLSLRLMEREN